MTALDAYKQQHSFVSKVEVGIEVGKTPDRAETPSENGQSCYRQDDGIASLFLHLVDRENLSALYT